MHNFRRRKSFPALDMDDLRPLMLDPAEGEPDQHAVECAPEELPAHYSESEQRAQRQERRAFHNILILGLSFLLVFTSFNTNGIMTVSTLACHYRMDGCQHALPVFISTLFSGLVVRHLCLLMCLAC